MSINNYRTMSSANLTQLEAKLKPLQKHLARIPLVVWQRLVRAILVIWLAYVLAQAFWILIPKPVIPAAKIEISTSGNLQVSAGDQSSSVDIDQLKKLTPFGNPAAQAEAVKTDASNIEHEAADTQLNLVLRGLVYSSDEKVARAVIASSDKQEVYAVGDPIPMSNNVTVAKILADRVIINNNGKFESLWLFKDDPNAPKIRSTYTANPSIDNQMASAQPPVYYDDQNTQNYSVPTPVEQNNAAQIGNTLSDVVAMSIHRENGQIVGYKIRPGRNAEMFNNLGLQPDDVVTAVNGMPLNNPGKIMEIYRSMGSATSANLQILRNGSTVNLDISLNQ
jgi:general secretion pathway protein C